jgi:hypothetical protein
VGGVEFGFQARGWLRVLLRPNPACILPLDRWFHQPIGLYLLCTYSIAYFFADCNWQVDRKNKIFFVQNVEKKQEQKVFVDIVHKL